MIEKIKDSVFARLVGVVGALIYGEAYRVECNQRVLAAALRSLGFDEALDDALEEARRIGELRGRVAQLDETDALLGSAGCVAEFLFVMGNRMRRVPDTFKTGEELNRELLAGAKD